MEAKVDIRKLQLLNDRITQTIDALNQVRLSVHGLGLGHSAMSPAAFGSSQAFGHPQALSGLAGASSGFQSGFQGFPASIGALGLQHSTMNPLLLQSLWAQNPYAFQSAAASPFASQLGVGSLASSLGAHLQSPLGGLSHSSPEMLDQLRASDPYRISQTFPFLGTPMSPLASAW